VIDIAPVNTPPCATLLVIDAGNTRAKWGVLAGAEPDAGALPRCQRSGAVELGAPLPWSELICDHGTAGRCAAITGSNPHEAARIADEWPHNWSPPLIVHDRRSFPIAIDVDFPEQVGIDRLLTAIAANVVRTSDQPAIIIDSGTATTVNFVDPRGHFCGGAILPGFDLCARALHEYTALLPLIEMTDVLDSSATPAELGRNTHAAISSGLYWGHVGAVKELLQRMTAGCSAMSATLPLVLLTGGAAPLLRPHLPDSIRLEPHLALQGLAIVARRLLSDE
jgi:type III pantothenate kinase